MAPSCVPTGSDWHRGSQQHSAKVFQSRASLQLGCEQLHCCFAGERGLYTAPLVSGRYEAGLTSLPAPMLQVWVMQEHSRLLSCNWAEGGKERKGRFGFLLSEAAMHAEELCGPVALLHQKLSTL